MRFPCRPGQSVLEAMRSVHHVAISAGCHNGGCGVCKVEILTGEIERGRMSAAHITREEAEAGVVLACRAYPVSHCEIKVIGAVPKRLARKYGFLCN
jgi:ferredoxin